MKNKLDIEQSGDHTWIICEVCGVDLAHYRENEITTSHPRDMITPELYEAHARFHDPAYAEEISIDWLPFGRCPRCAEQDAYYKFHVTKKGRVICAGCGTSWASDGTDPRREIEREEK